MLRILVFTSLSLLLSSCSSTRRSSSPFVNPHDCFKWIGKNDFENFQKSISICQNIKSDNGTTALMLAAARGQDAFVRLLLKQGVDVNETDHHGDTALNYTVATNRVEMALFLVLSGAQVPSKRKDGITSLMQATQFGSYEMIKVLSQDPQGINQRAEDGWTALYFAIRRKEMKILKLLLQQGACLTPKDRYEQTPLDFIKEVQWPEGFEVLQKAPKCPA